MNNVVIKKEESFSIHILLLIFAVSAAIVLVLWQFENAKLPENVGRETVFLLNMRILVPMRIFRAREKSKKLPFIIWQVK